MQIVQGLNQIRLKIRDGQHMFWTGKNFTFNRAYAKRYKTQKAARRAMYHIHTAIKSGLRTREEIGLSQEWSDIHGLFEVIVVALDDSGNMTQVSRGGIICWLRGYKSYVPKSFTY